MKFKVLAGLALAAVFSAAAVAAPVAYVNSPFSTPQELANSVITNVNTTLAPTGSGTIGSTLNIPAVASAVNQFNLTAGATGVAPIISAGGPGADANVGITLAGNGTGAVLVGGTTTTLAGLQVAQTASRVNDFVLTPAATGNTPGFLAGGAGSDATVGVAFGTQGTGTVAINTGNTLQQFGITHTASAVNAFSVTGSIGSNAPVMSVVGTGTNVPASITGKGTGLVLLGQTICTITGSTPQTCNGQRGIVTTGTLSTAGATNAAFVINNSSVTATSLVMCTDQGYSGTLVTNGYPVIMSCVPGSGTITVNITNTHAANALNGTVQIGFTVLN